jgi:predicted ATPase
MISRVVGDKPLPANIRQDIIERTDGIPLFVDSLMARLDRLGPAKELQ